jgi:predicted alpha/beta superfamily hydrolase
MSAMLHGCLADTDYLEVSAKSGHLYGVWVTTPPGYADGNDPLPLIYVMDGNFAVGQTAPLIVSQADPYLTIAPYIQVSVGYAADEAAEWARLRNRDLVPPGEPVSGEMVATLESAREAGAMSQEQMDAYLHELRDTHADVFLSFLADELHPQLTSQYRVSETGHGLFGYSYGGLFALYAWLNAGLDRATPFVTVGAGSPGVLGADSQIFELLRKLPERQTETDLPRLHITVNQLEMLGDVPIYRGLARQVLMVVEELHSQGRTQEVSTALLHETHVTGVQASFLSYLKACHAR